MTLINAGGISYRHGDEHRPSRRQSNTRGTHFPHPVIFTRAPAGRAAGCSDTAGGDAVARGVGQRTYNGDNID